MDPTYKKFVKLISYRIKRMTVAKNKECTVVKDHVCEKGQIKRFYVCHDRSQSAVNTEH